MWLLGWMQPLFWLLILTQGIPTFSSKQKDQVKCTQCDVDTCDGNKNKPDDCSGSKDDSCFTEYIEVVGSGDSKVKQKGNRGCAVFDETETKSLECKAKAKNPGDAVTFYMCLCKEDECNSDEKVEELLKGGGGGGGGGGGDGGGAGDGGGGKGAASHLEISKALLWTSLVVLSVYRCNSILEGRCR